MTTTTRQQLSKEVDLIGRFAQSYHRKLSVMIDRMNTRHDPAADLASLRLCVEAVGVMLSNQTELARVLRELADADPNPRRQAA